MNMTSKDLHIAIKNGHGVQYMMERYQFEKEENLYEAIRTITPSGAPGFINDLKKNQKKLDKKAKRNTQAKAKLQASEQHEAETTSTDEPIVITKSSEEKEIQQHKTLEELQKEEQELSATLCKLEDAHKQMVAQRRDCISRFKRAKKALTELQRILLAQQDNVSAIYEEYEALDCMMQKNNKECSVNRQLLQGVRSQIEDLRKVIIFVYKNGIIEVENANIPSISEESINIGVTELISFPNAEEFTIKELKTIAKVRLMVEAIKQNDCGFELVFDSLEVQKFYETVVA